MTGTRNDRPLPLFDAVEQPQPRGVDAQSGASPNQVNTASNGDTITNPSVHPDEVLRLSRQCRLILKRLRLGRASNAELSGLALKYTSRISDLRAAGFDVRVVERDYGSGLVWYQLFV